MPTVMPARPAVARAVAAMTALVAIAGLPGCSRVADVNPVNTPALAAPPAASAESVTVRRLRAAAHRDRRRLVAAIRRAVTEQRGSHHTFDLSEGRVRLTGTGDMDYRGHGALHAVMAASIGSRRGGVELRAVHGLYYLSIEHLMRADQFVRLDPMSPTSPLGPVFARLSRQIDPMQALVAMTAGFRRVTPLGYDTVQGEATAHYRVAVDVDAGLAGRGLTARRMGLPPGLTYHLWLDEHQLVRRIKLRTSWCSSSQRWYVSPGGRPIRRAVASPWTVS